MSLVSFTIRLYVAVVTIGQALFVKCNSKFAIHQLNLYFLFSSRVFILSALLKQINLYDKVILVINRFCPEERGVEIIWEFI